MTKQDPLAALKEHDEKTLEEIEARVTSEITEHITPFVKEEFQKIYPSVEEAELTPFVKDFVTLLVNEVNDVDDDDFFIDYCNVLEGFHQSQGLAEEVIEMKHKLITSLQEASRLSISQFCHQKGMEGMARFFGSEPGAMVEFGMGVLNPETGEMEQVVFTPASPDIKNTH